MESAAVVAILFGALSVVGMVLVAGIRAGRDQRAADLALLADLARVVGGPADPERMRVAGSSGGRAVRIDLALHEGSDRTRGTCVTTPIAALPLAFELRPQTYADVDAVAAGRAVDLVTGDDAFDAAFVVEAAPADVALAALDAARRRRLPGPTAGTTSPACALPPCDASAS